MVANFLLPGRRLPRHGGHLQDGQSGEGTLLTSKFRLQAAAIHM